MIRLILLLLVGIGMAMYFADSFPEPAKKSTKLTETPPAEVNEISPPASQATENAALIENIPDTPALIKTETPAEQNEAHVANKETIEAPTYATLFKYPAVVGANGGLKLSVAPEPEPGVATTAILADVWFVTGERVNVRKGPSTATEVTEQVNFAEAVEVLTDPVDGWVKIRIEGDGVEGYIANRFLQRNNPLE